MTTHSYVSRLAWRGSTGDGVGSYTRDHLAVAPPARGQFALSADPAFRGDRERPNPEQLLVMAASSCQLLSFLALAARGGIDVRQTEADSGRRGA